MSRQARPLFVIEDGGDIIGAVTYEVVGYDTGLKVRRSTTRAASTDTNRCLQS